MTTSPVRFAVYFHDKKSSFLSKRELTKRNVERNVREEDSIRGSKSSVNVNEQKLVLSVLNIHSINRELAYKSNDLIWYFNRRLLKCIFKPLEVNLHTYWLLILYNTCRMLQIFQFSSIPFSARSKKSFLSDTIAKKDDGWGRLKWWQ